MRNYWTDSFNPQQFLPQGAKGNPSVTFKEFLYDAQKERGMLRSIIVEDKIKQEFWISIGKKKKGWLIQIADGCAAIPFEGVGLAVDLAYEAVKGSLHE